MLNKNLSVRIFKILGLIKLHAAGYENGLIC
jgi:hypothetical protein